jgi:hypothetical protein
MKDLKLKVGDKCYIGREEWECVEVDSSFLPYKIENNRISTWISREGSPDAWSYLYPIVSLEPYDFPEMVYDKPLEIGKPHYFWDGASTSACYTILKRVDKTEVYPYETVDGFWYNLCSPTPPELPIK